MLLLTINNIILYVGTIQINENISIHSRKHTEKIPQYIRYLLQNCLNVRLPIESHIICYKTIKLNDIKISIEDFVRKYLIIFIIIIIIFFVVLLK